MLWSQGTDRPGSSARRLPEGGGGEGGAEMGQGVTILSTPSPAAAAAAAKSLQSVRLCATPETAIHKAPPSLGDPRDSNPPGSPVPGILHPLKK